MKNSCECDIEHTELRMRRNKRTTSTKIKSSKQGIFRTYAPFTRRREVRHYMEMSFQDKIGRGLGMIKWKNAMKNNAEKRNKTNVRARKTCRDRVYWSNLTEIREFSYSLSKKLNKNRN